MSGRQHWLAGAAMAALLAGPALAQESTVRGHQAGDFMIGASVIGLIPQSGGRVDVIGGRPDASATATGQLDFTYFFLPNLSLNLIAATTRHDVSVRGSALGNVDLGHVWALPPTLTVQFHPLPRSRFSPYLGAGVNYTVFYGEGGSRTPPVTRVDVHNAWGFALNAGIDVELAPNWLVNFDVKKIFLRPDVSVNHGLITATTQLDPSVIGLGLRYRF